MFNICKTIKILTIYDNMSLVNFLILLYNIVKLTIKIDLADSKILYFLCKTFNLKNEI